MKTKETNVKTRKADVARRIVEKELEKIPGEAGTFFFYQPKEPKGLMRQPR